MYKKIILAVDGSENATRAIRKVIEFQRQWDSEVIMFHSIFHQQQQLLIPIAISSNLSSYIHLEKKSEEKLKEEGEELLKFRRKMFNNAHLAVDARLITSESPEQYILRIVDEESVDLIVIGLKGIHSKLKELFIGSIPKKVIKYAPCDILIVK